MPMIQPASLLLLLGLLCFFASTLALKPTRQSKKVVQQYEEPYDEPYDESYDDPYDEVDPEDEYHEEDYSDEEYESDEYEDEEDYLEEDEDDEIDDVEDEEDDMDEDDILNLQSLAEDSLRGHSHSVATLESMISRLEEVVKKSGELRDRHQRLLLRSKGLGELVNIVNGIQVEALAKQLNETLEKELESRLQAVQVVEEASSEEAAVDGVPMDALREMLGPDTILEKSNVELEKWALLAIEEEMRNLPQLLKQQSSAVPESCVSATEAAHLVLESLMSHGSDLIGRLDHMKGGKVVHELTSEAFEPKPTEREKIGKNPWRRYIPEDWERLLPDGWEEWSTTIPSVLYEATGTKGAPTAPAEVVMSSSIHPGACWPMKGRSGQITLQLQYPVKVTAVTVDHVSSLLVKRAEGSSSAPKRIRVHGYPSCASSCHGMPFDFSRRIEIATFEYDLRGSSVQTFEISGGEESCSEETTSCSADLDSFQQVRPKTEESVFRAVTFEILDNWGLADYTCLYRLRVHGDPIR